MRSRMLLWMAKSLEEGKPVGNPRNEGEARIMWGRRVRSCHKAPTSGQSEDSFRVAVPAKSLCIFLRAAFHCWLPLCLLSKYLPETSVTCHSRQLIRSRSLSSRSRESYLDIPKYVICHSCYSVSFQHRSRRDNG